MNKARNYFEKHPEFNSVVHAVGGVGVGILIASPVADPHPVRWGLVLLGLSAIGHLYPYMVKK